MDRREFEEEIRGSEWRWQRWEDLVVATVTLPLMAAWGGGKKENGEYFTPADLLGREPVRLMPARPLTEAEEEAAEWEAMQAEAKRARALLKIYEMNVLRAQREGQPAPEIVSGGG